MIRSLILALMLWNLTACCYCQRDNRTWYSLIDYVVLDVDGAEV